MVVAVIDKREKGRDRNFVLIDEAVTTKKNSIPAVKQKHNDDDSNKPKRKKKTGDVFDRVWAAGGGWMSFRKLFRNSVFDKSKKLEFDEMGSLSYTLK